MLRRFISIVRKRILPAYVIAVLASATPGLCVDAGKADSMNPRVTHVAGFTVVGISGRTNNAKEMTAGGIIGKLWGRLMQENVLATIPSRADANILAIYTDYASDHNGDYTYVLGAKVTGDARAPVGMVSVRIPSGKYAVFTSARGPAYKVVPDLWRKINSLPKAATGGDRTYRSDFEVYDERARNPQDAIVDVYLGIR